jgi:hypothetical protein
MISSEHQLLAGLVHRKLAVRQNESLPIH